MSFELLCYRVVRCAVWEYEASFAVSALQEAAHWGHQDTDVVRRRRRRTVGRHCIFQLSTDSTIIRLPIGQAYEGTPADRLSVIHRR